MCADRLLSMGVFVAWERSLIFSTLILDTLFFYFQNFIIFLTWAYTNELNTCIHGCGMCADRLLSMGVYAAWEISLIFSTLILNTLFFYFKKCIKVLWIWHMCRGCLAYLCKVEWKY